MSQRNRPAIAVLGGTGPEGFGLALRWARAGETVIIGSRDAGRAREAAAKIQTARRQQRKNFRRREHRRLRRLPICWCSPFRSKATPHCSSKSSRRSVLAASWLTPRCLWRPAWADAPLALSASGKVLPRSRPPNSCPRAFPSWRRFTTRRRRLLNGDASGRLRRDRLQR